MICYNFHRCAARGGEGSQHYSNNRTTKMKLGNGSDVPLHHYNNTQPGGRMAQVQPHSHCRIYQGPQSLKAPHLPIQFPHHQITQDCIQNGGMSNGHSTASTPPPAPPKQGDENNSVTSGSLTPDSQPRSSPTLLPGYPVDLPTMNMVNNGMNANQTQQTSFPSQFHHYPSHIHPRSQAPVAQDPPTPQPMRQLNLVWQGLPPNAQIDPEQMFILSGKEIFYLTKLP